MPHLTKLLPAVALVLSLTGLTARDVAAQPAPAAGTFLCDVAYEDCRAKVLTLIRNETTGIDLSFWFMTDARYSNEIVKRWQAGVPVRVLMDPRASVSKPANATQVQQLKDAGIPMLNKPFGDIAHWKGMIFREQEAVEFSGANYSPNEYLYSIPYVDYHDETIYFSKEPDVVQSLMRRFDDVWMDSIYTFYANPITRVRTHSSSFLIAPEFNFPPNDSYANRLLPLLDAEDQGIDVVMYRITDSRPADRLIDAVKRAVPVRLYAEPDEYRNPKRPDDSYNVDRMYMGGVQIRMRAHTGQSHQKTVRLHRQRTTIFGTSNWSRASDDNQLEVNYFTTKEWFYRFFENQFNWKWNNRPPDGSTTVQSKDFIPLAPGSPTYRAPANAATGVGTTAVLTWNGGTWARRYDVYFGVGTKPLLYRRDLAIGPGDNRSFTVTDLLPGTTYSWKIVSRTMANVISAGPLWTFTTAGTPPADQPAAPGDTTAPLVYLYYPANGATVSGTLDLHASSADNVGVSGVRFKLNDNYIGAEDLSAPYKLTWDTTLLANGTYTLTAESRDAARSVAISFPTTTVTVSNTQPVPDITPPTVAITSPSDGATVSGTITVTASAADDRGIARVRFSQGATELGVDSTAPYSVSWNTTLEPNGPAEITAEASDAAGLTASASVNVIINNNVIPPADTTRPTVSVTAPASGATVWGDVSITATASDEGGTVASVQFQVDEVDFGLPDTMAPYSISWNTRPVSSGVHTLTARATDAAGNQKLSSPITVTVSNRTVVLFAADVPAVDIHNNWIKQPDATAAEGFALWNRNNNDAKVAPALALPVHFVEIEFDAEAGTAYHLWIRIRAEGNSWSNDSIHVQFSDAVDAAGAPIYRTGSTGTTNSAQVVLQETDSGPVSGWGWADQGWNGAGPPIYFDPATSGRRKLRIQQREDGAMFDQIVLSPDRYLTAAPGAQTQDATRLPRSW